MAGHGGPRKPAHPAPVSGPGRLSRRTDGGPTQALSVASGLPYGDRQGLLDSEKTAGMAAADPAPSTPKIQVGPPPQNGGPGQGAPPQMTPFGAPTQNPNEPVTNGVDIGAGQGSDAIQTSSPQGVQPTGYLTNVLQQLSTTDTTGTIGALYLMAQQRGV